MSLCSKSQASLSDLTFGELQKINFNDVPKIVSKEAAIDLCRKSLLEFKIPAANISSLWFQKLLRGFTKTSWTNVDDWRELLTFLDEVRLSLISRLNSEQLECLAEYSTYLCDALDFAKWAQPFLMNADESVVSSICSFLLITVLDFAKFDDECDDDCNLEEHIAIAVELHQWILNVINEFVDGVVHQDTATQDLTILIPQLCEAGELLQSLSLKIIIETWKTVTKLSKHFLHKRRHDTPPSWFNKPLNALLAEVAKNICTVYQEDTLSVPIEQIEKFMRVTNFYTQLLSELFTIGSQYIDDQTLKTYLKTLVSLHCKPTVALSQDILILLERYLHKELLQLLQFVFQRKGLHGLFLDYFARERTSIHAINLVWDFLNVAISSESVLTSESCHFYINLFELLFKDSHFIVSTTTYDQLLEMYAAIVCIDTTGTIFNYLHRAMFDQNPALNLASAQVLLVVLHSAVDFVSDAELLASFRLWLNLSQGFAVFSTNPRQLLAQQMVSFSFELCCRRSSVLKRELCGSANAQFDIGQYRFLQCVGGEHLPYSLSNNLLALLTNASKFSFTVEKYYEMIACMKLVANNNLLSNQLPFLDQLIFFCQRIQRQNKIRPGYRIFLDTFYAMLAGFATKTKLFVFEKLFKDGVVSHNGSTSWHMQKYLLTCGEADFRFQQRVEQLISANADDTRLLNEIWRITKQTNETKNNNFSNTTKITLEPQPEKRLRLMQNEDNKTKHIVSRLSAQLEELKTQKLDADDKCALRKIAFNMLNLIENKDRDCL